MDSCQSPLRRTTTQRRSIGSCKRTTRRSTTGISPLAMALLRSQLERKEVALLQQELLAIRTRSNDHKDAHTIDVDRQEIITDLDIGQAKPKRGQKFRAVRRRMSKAVARVFHRKSSKKSEKRRDEETEGWGRFPVTEL